MTLVAVPRDDPHLHLFLIARTSEGGSSSPGATPVVLVAFSRYEGAVINFYPSLRASRLTRIAEAKISSINLAGSHSARRNSHFSLSTLRLTRNGISPVNSALISTHEGPWR